MVERPEVPSIMVHQIRDIVGGFPQILQKPAWMGIRWQVAAATVAHVFGGEDQLFRITFHAEPDEVMAFEHLGAPYFRPSWGSRVVGMLLDEKTDWVELGELLTDSYCLQAPTRLSQLIQRPGEVDPISRE